MKKIITENPEGLVSHMHNFVFIKDKEVYVRIDEYPISLIDYIRKMDEELYGIQHDNSYCNAENFGEYMDDDRITCTMYHVLVGFAEVREHLKYYEDKLGKTNIEEITRVIARNCIAWDTSKDKTEGLLPEVAVFTNPSMYEELTGEKYSFHKACKKFL